MGGDYGPSVTIPAALNCLNKHPHLMITLVGDEAVLLQALKQHHASPHSRLALRHALRDLLSRLWTGHRLFCS